MSRPSSSAATLDKTQKNRSRTNSQTSFHVRTKSHPSPTPPHHHLAGSGNKRSSGQYSGSSTLNPSPLKMVTTSTTNHHRQDDPACYYVLADNESQGYEWMVSTVIEDDDLTFGGKSLSAWYEEDRQKVSFPEEERRGRQRVRQHHHHSYSHHPKTKAKTSGGEHKQH